MQNTINLVDVSTDGLYLVFCLSGQREVSGKPLHLIGAKVLAGLGSGQKLQGQSEQTGCGAPQGKRPRDSQLCCCDSPGKRAGDTRVTAGTPTKAGETQQQLFCSYVLFEKPTKFM